MLLGNGEYDGTVSPGQFCVWHTVYHDRLLLHRHLMSLFSLCWVFGLFGGVGGLRAYADPKRERGMAKDG